MSVEKYKVGDKVLVKSLDWYNENKNGMGDVLVPCTFVEGMSQYCGKVLTIRRVGISAYCVEECGYSWSDEMFERLIEPLEVYAMTKDVRHLPKGVAECARVLGIDADIIGGYGAPLLFTEFQKLIMCRNAYWKLADDWKPDYKNREKKHCIVMRCDKVSVATTIEANRIFSFPTPEMADTFKKNFVLQLDYCRELL